MKKYIAFCAALVILVFALVGCGNESWGLGNYTYTHVHASDSVEGYCATIDSWHDNDRGIELHTKEFGDIFLSEGTYMLFANKSGCPYCGN